MEAGVYCEADGPSDEAHDEHAHAQLPAFLRRALALCHRLSVVVENLVRHEADGEAGEVAEDVFQQLVNRENVVEDLRRDNVGEDFLVQCAAHGGPEAEEQESREIGEHFAAALAQHGRLGQDEEQQDQERDAAGHGEVGDGGRTVVREAPRHEIQQQAADHVGARHAPTKGGVHEGRLLVGKARELQPLGEEGEDGPWRRARCPLEKDQNEGRIPSACS
mmetsp:Transcript_89571/g.175317  ORF Transcript_89571/g.175317 Transcript_89571/m.175317 type:complete len:220 (-) Transcript_89571:21-680(-)